MTNRYFIFISYNGASYHGWQVQAGAVTVQSVLEETLSTILGEKIAVTGAGRTDSGVHARYFCAHFDSIMNDLATSEKIVYRLNSFLPRDISVFSIRRVLPDANARFSAVSRTYKYYIARYKNPFVFDSSWLLRGKIDVSKMNEACRILLTHEDFTSFSRLHSGAKTNICHLYLAEWEETEEMLVFTVKADRFLRNMVRAIVGTMTDVGFGKLSPHGFEQILIGRDRCLAGMSAPAKGLFLTGIEYPSAIFI